MPKQTRMNSVPAHATCLCIGRQIPQANPKRSKGSPRCIREQHPYNLIPVYRFPALPHHALQSFKRTKAMVPRQTLSAHSIQSRQRVRPFIQLTPHPPPVTLPYPTKRAE